MSLDDIPEYMSKTTYAPCNAKFKTLGEIDSVKDSIPAHCFDSYIADVMIEVLNTALTDYFNMVKNGYDNQFKVYDKYTRDQAPVNVAAYMSSAAKSGNFQCTVQKYIQCCNKCSSAFSCPNGCSNAANCQSGNQQVATDCPTEIPTADTDYFKEQVSITYTITNEANFYSELSDKYGILKDWISLGDYMVHLANGCQFAGDQVNECIKKQSTFWHNYPNINYDKLSVPNPKDVISGAYDKTKGLLDTSTIAKRFAPYDFGGARNSDMVDALSVPAMFMSEAVGNMKQVVETANKIIEAERKAMIADFITGFFMLIPFVGEAAGALGGATLRSIILMAGELGNVGYTVYELVDNPKGALGTIFGFLLGGVSLRPFKDAAGARRGLKDGDVQKMPPRVKTDLGTIGSLRGACLRK